MPRFFFDVHEDHQVQRDTTGVELATVEDARREAQRLLPDLAREEIPRDGDRKTYVVLVTDEDGRAIYSATLAYTGLWLLR